MLLLWTEKLRLGVEEFDDAHKRLIVLVNRLHAAIQAGTSNRVLEAVLNELEYHVRHQCTREEMLFLETGFPDAAAHTEEHNELRRMVAKMHLRFASGTDADLPLDVMNLIYVWVTNHIYRADRRSSEFMHAKGIYHAQIDAGVPTHASARETPAQFLASDSPGANHEIAAHNERIAPMMASERVMGTSIQRAPSILSATKASSAPNP